MNNPEPIERFNYGGDREEYIKRLENLVFHLDWYIEDLRDNKNKNKSIKDILEIWGF